CPNGADRRILPVLGDEFLRDSGELLEVPPTRILNLHREPARCAKAPDRGGVEREDQRLGDLGELLESRPDECLDVLVRALPLVPEMQGSKDSRSIGPARAK